MPEYDAFGREIGDDPLAALREATAAPPREREATEVAEPTVVVAPEGDRPAPAPVAPRPRFVRPRVRVRRRGSFAGLLVIAAFVASIGLVTTFVADRVEDLTPALPEIADTEPAVRGLQARSLIRRDNLAAALEVLRESGAGRPVTLRVAPDRVDAALAGPQGIRQVQVTADHRLRTLATVDAAKLPPATPYRRIDAAAPERLVRRGPERAQRVEYVLLVPGRPLGWRAYFRNGAVTTGDARGRRY